jgi:hypothetical protein
VYKGTGVKIKIVIFPANLTPLDRKKFTPQKFVFAEYLILNFILCRVGKGKMFFQNYKAY